MVEAVALFGKGGFDAFAQGLGDGLQIFEASGGDLGEVDAGDEQASAFNAHTGGVGFEFLDGEAIGDVEQVVEREGWGILESCQFVVGEDESGSPFGVESQGYAGAE